eukprot:gene8398-926_t
MRTRTRTTPATPSTSTPAHSHSRKHTGTHTRSYTSHAGKTSALQETSISSSSAPQHLNTSTPQHLSPRCGDGSSNTSRISARSVSSSFPAFPQMKRLFRNRSSPCAGTRNVCNGIAYFRVAPCCNVFHG